MRETFTTLQTMAHEATQTESTDTTINTFLKSEINRAYRLVQAELDNYTTQVVRTSTTVADQQFYHKPPDVVNIESIYITINGVDYVLESVGNQRVWDHINSVTFSGSAIPQYFFQRRDDIGIYPTPQGAYTMTMTYIPRYPDLANADYTTGTVTVTNGDATVTGSGTTFTASMVGRWFKANDDGEWYRIASFTSSTEIELENNYQGTTASGEAYTIGETPEIPEELHEILSFRAAEMYFIKKRNDATQASLWGNMFYTGDPQNNSRELSRASGGLLGAVKRYSSRASVGLVRRKPIRGRNTITDKIWGTVLSNS